MLEYNLDISPDSQWVISTQPAAARIMPFFLTETGHFRAGEDYYTARSDREGYYLLYTAAGEGIVELKSGAFPLPKGHAALLCCQPSHRYAAAGDGVWDNHWVHLDGFGVAPYFEGAADTPIQLRDPAAFEELFGLLPGLAAREDAAGLAQTSHTLSGLLTALLLSNMEDGNASLPHRADISRAVEYIRQHYRNPISVDDITEALNLSKFHFVRLFRRQMGVTPYRYLIQHRISQSKLLLATGDLPVAQVAVAVGYASESNFIRQFRELAGMTPLQYRRSNRSYGI